ncbi:MAG: ABC transporter substrate-binding protein [Bacteroidota bacterium]|jgi:ABC-type transport system substrate-binding protein
MHQKQETLKIFRYNEPGGITSLDPAFARTTENIWALNQLFNGLVQLDSNLRVAPCIAYRWEITDSARQYVFHLRQDVFFHDSPCFRDKKRRVTSADVVYSLNRLKDPKTGSPGAWTMSAVAHQGISAPDDSTLLIRLTKPYYPFLSLLTHPYCSVIPPEAVAFFGSSFRANPVGTGPFMFKAWAENEKLVLRKNPHYFELLMGKRLPFIDGVAISFIKDRQTAYFEFLRGNFDFMSGIDGSYKDDLLDEKGNLQKRFSQIRQHRMPYLKTDYLGLLSSGHPALQNNYFRKALSAAIDREELIRVLRNGIGEASGGSFVPKPLMDVQMSKREGSVSMDAASLLKLSGVKVSEQMPLVISTTAAYADVCEYIQQQWSALGIPCKVDVLLPSVQSKAIAEGSLMCFRKSWVADYADAENFLSVFYEGNIPPAGPNYTRFNHPEFNRMYREYNTSMNAHRGKLAYRMDSLVMAEQPVIPLYTDEAVVFYHARVSGMQFNAMNLLQLKTTAMQ